MPTKAKPKKLSTRAERGFKTYRVKSAAEKKPPRRTLSAVSAL